MLDSYVSFSLNIDLLGELRWKKNSLIHGFITGFYGSSVVLDCEMIEPSINVMFLIMKNGPSFTNIMIDGIKYQRIGRQKLRINSLDVDDAVPHVCRADGITDKHIHVSITKSKYRIMISIGSIVLVVNSQSHSYSNFEEITL